MKMPLLTATLCTATMIASQAQPGGPQQGGRPPMPPVFMLLDQDRNGVLSDEEIEQAAQLLSQLDTNYDGLVSLQEILPPRPERPDEEDSQDDAQGPPQGGHQGPPLIAALDSDKDGVISEGEIESASESLESLDQNEDGELSHDEYAGHHGGPPPCQ